MKHFGIIQWVDFARGVLPDAEGIRMRQHLAGGCPDCQGIADFCDKLSAICRGSNPCHVPDAAVQQARAIFQARLVRSPKSAFRIPVELIFDSFLVPAPAGLRASWQIGWQALYRAGECSLDLRVEPELHTCRAALIGQVSNHELPNVEMTDIPVCLKSGKVVVAQTRSNRFGEFQMEYEQQKRLQLHVSLDGGSRCIQVPLKTLVADKPVGGDRLRTGLSPRLKKNSKQ
jgi:hypothetical protein